MGVAFCRKTGVCAVYQNFLFDFYGTLVDIRTDEQDPFVWEKLSEIYCGCGAHYTPRELESELRRLEKEQAETIDLPCPEPDLTEVFAELYRLKGIACDASTARMTAIIFRTLSRRTLRLYDGVTDLFRELRARGKNIYLLSNAQTDFTRPEIEMMGLSDAFDGIFISSEHRCKKPSLAFFRALLDTFHLEPATCLMIGNDPQSDVAGAKTAGMDSLYLRTATSPFGSDDGGATYAIWDGDFRKIQKLIFGQ